MPTNDDVLIIGSLDDKALTDSIDKLISEVSDKSQEMANKFESAIHIMNSAMKDFAINQKVSVDLMKQAWREMSSSFDAMVAAQEGATGGGGKPATFEDDTVGKLKQEISLLEQERDRLKLNTDELRTQNEEIAKRRALLKSETTSDIGKDLIRANAMVDKTLPDAEAKLKELLRIKNELRSTPILDEKGVAKLDKSILTLINRIRDMRRNAAGTTLKDVLGMDESSVDAIARKMRALKNIKVDTNTSKGRAEVRLLGEEYQRLNKRMQDYLGKNLIVQKANDGLARSFGYIRNRLVYAMTLGAITNFVKQMYEVRGQYELLERSLGILIDDMRRGSEMFQELNRMALKSPFTLMELATGAKQLLAYNFAEEEVVDTTRRLADISAALGVPMERLVYNLGQIRAQTVLTARDARDFANAGLAIVPMLAQLYTEEKRFGNEMVTTAQVFDMMSDKMVSYADVMKVINRVTDEGGKFYDFQAKQADTLRVKLANLTLAFNNMLNEMGAENQGAMELPLRTLKYLFENWKAVFDIVSKIVVLYGIYRARAILVAAVNGTLITQGLITGMFKLGQAVRGVVEAWKVLTVVVASNPLGAIATVLATMAGYMLFFGNSTQESTEYIEKFGEAGAKAVRQTETLFDSLAGISKESSNYKKVMDELNSILGEYNIELVKESDDIEEVNKKRAVAIGLIKEEALERKHLNDIQQGRENYETAIEKAKKDLRDSLKTAMTGDVFLSGNEELQKNADAISNIISDIVESNISLIANKTGDEYQKGIDKIYSIIQDRMRAIGISESTIASVWVDDSLFFHEDIVRNFIDTVQEAKEGQDSFNDAIDRNYEAEKKAAEQNVTFEDKVERTRKGLMKSANDTEAFTKKIETLLKSYGGQNVIDFMVRVKTEVPAWMSQKGLTELSKLSARFTALATNAKKAGKQSVSVNGVDYTTEQLFQRAAQYAQAAKDKAADIEARKTSTITKEASSALKDYKTAIEAVRIAKNRLKQGTADQALVTEKEAEAQAKWNKALEKGVSLSDLMKAKNGSKGGGSKKDPLGDALSKEIQLIADMQKMYKEYRKVGVDADEARIASAKEYEKTLTITNATLKKFGITGLTGEKLVSMELRDIRDYYQTLLVTASKLNNTKGVEALEKAIRNLNQEITKTDYKKFTDGLNNELGKIKEEYEIGIEFDANPELGNIFADMMGIKSDELESLPRTFDQVAARLQNSIDTLFKDNHIDKQFDLVSMLDKGNFDEWVKAQGNELDDNFAKALNNIREYANKIRLDETKATTEEWNKLIDKYGGLQAKLVKISKDTAKQQLDIIKKFGTEKQKQDAMDISKKLVISQDPETVADLQRQLADLMNKVVQGNQQGVNIAGAVTNEKESMTSKAYWEDFKESNLYEMTFEDMSRVATSSIQLIIDKMEELKSKVKEDPASMKALTSALREARDELESRSSTVTIVDALREMKEAAREAAEAKQNLADADGELKDAEEQYANAQATANPTAMTKAEERLTRARERYKQAVEDSIKADNRAKAAREKLKAGLSLLSSELQNIQGLFGAFSKILRAVGMDDAADAVDSINEGFSLMITLIMGINAAMVILESEVPWLLAIAAALSVIVGLVSWLSGNNNKQIDKEVKQSELAVKRLENSYKNLEQAVNDAYGAMQIAAKKAEIANKKLQLAELERQLQLERSRDSKDRDAGKIADLEGQIIDMKNEIKNMQSDITSSFLGISSVSDAVQSMMDDIVDALREGEDAMATFDGAIDDMIANMIKQVFSARILGPMLEKIWNKIDDDIQSRGESYADYLAKYQASLDHIMTVTGDTGKGYYFWKDANGALNYSNNIWKFRAAAMEEGFQALSYEQWKAILTGWRDAQQDALERATTPTMDDVRRYAEDLRGVSPELQQYMDSLESILEEMGLINKKETSLSKLQQGIQGVTEDTAGAIEAYMNIVSQRVFEQNVTLAEIRDQLLGFNLDVQVATISQMLLQLQQSYQVQQSIESILRNVLNPTERAICVELIS